MLCSYVRLELLQAVAAFHTGHEAAGQHLQAALAKWQRLQVSDHSLAALAALGFSTSKVQSATLVFHIVLPGHGPTAGREHTGLCWQTLVSGFVSAVAHFKIIIISIIEHVELRSGLS